jgi:4-aminobutyrate aminotransferase-like enzyme
VAVDIVRRYGGIFVSDEVQTGLGRTGREMWGIEHYGVVPDVMTMAKGIANGLPLAATVARPEVASAIEGLTIATFGGNPVACAAGCATLDYIRDRALPDHVSDVGALLREGLEELQRQFPKVVGDVRGMGLMQAIELVVDETAGDRTPNPGGTLTLLEVTKKSGLLLGRGGLHGNVIRISPPMTVSRSEIEEGVGLLGESLAEICR